MARANKFFGFLYAHPLILASGPVSMPHLGTRREEASVAVRKSSAFWIDNVHAYVDQAPRPGPGLQLGLGRRGMAHGQDLGSDLGVANICAWAWASSEAKARAWSRAWAKAGACSWALPWSLSFCLGNGLGLVLDQGLGLGLDQGLGLCQGSEAPQSPFWLRKLRQTNDLLNVNSEKLYTYPDTLYISH